MKALEIKITTPQNPLRCHNLLAAVKKGKIDFTPEFALEFLQSTNNRKNIRDFIDILETHLNNHPETAESYGRILLGLAAISDQPEEINKKAEKLLQTHNIRHTNIEIIEKSWQSTDANYQSVNKLIFPEDAAQIQMERCDLSQTELDLSRSTFVTLMQFEDCQMPPKVDLSSSYIWALYYKKMDISSFETIYPEEMQFLSFENKTKFPQVLDLSKIKEIDTLIFSDCDMSNIQEIKFPQKMTFLHFQRAALPTCLDVEELKKNSYVIRNECTVPEKKIAETAKPLEEKTAKNNLYKWLKGKLNNAR